MKRNTILKLSLLVMVLTHFGCKKILDERPKSQLTAAFFLTPQGLQSGLDAAYGGNRYIYGSENFFTLTVGGTDEFTAGSDAGSNGDLFRYNSSFNSSSGPVSAIWRYCYTYINSCNAVIDYAQKVSGLSVAAQSQATAEAKFLRANYYFMLIQLYGDVTLNDHYQSEPATSATRTPIADVYKFIIQDLEDAINVLPASPKLSSVLPGKATKAAAMHLLAKVYLTRAGSVVKQAEDYKNSYTIATDLINNVAPANGLALLQDFGSVYAEGNEASSEVLWTVQHTSTLAYNGTTGYVDGDNALCHFFIPKYDLQPGMQRDLAGGRSFTRVMPTHWLTDVLFQERVNDKRYDKTFKTVWISNNAATIPKVSGVPKYAVGDTAIWMPGYEVSAAYVAAKRFQVIPPSKYSNSLFPSLTKYYDTKRADRQFPSIRPIIVYRLAETYLIATEALFMDGRVTDALPYINAVRERAAYPSANPKVMDVQASSLSIDFILDERAKELCGEQMRWFDLVRTNKLLERVRLYNPDAAQNIQAKHVLRPIPQSQIDATSTGVKYPQNTGW
ncbi:MAG: RagB/SusD family nutrient uptake outer membrane protein [Mucilaginibacter sp.]|uniref:RagB/SusD family nutrient uptake outer membrane protein n=1 Tax=Mucilaginibacter sp. TaxID=1882438 RepID=UPI0034E59948